MSRQCEPCCFLSKNNTATHKCEDCQEAYCLKCSEDHNKYRVFRRHKVSQLGQQEPTVGVYEDVSLESEMKELDVKETEIETNASHSGFDDLETDKKLLYSGSDALEDGPHYSTVEYDDQHVNHFYIDVEETPMSRAIGLKGQQYLLIVNKEIGSISISQDGMKKYECLFNWMMRCGVKGKKIAWVEIGRHCQYGPGILRFNTPNAKALWLCIKEGTAKK